jgi:hypothetical protein
VLTSALVTGALPGGRTDLGRPTVPKGLLPTAFGRAKWRATLIGVATKIGDLLGEGIDHDEGRHEFSVAGRELFGESCVRVGQVCDRPTIFGSGSGQICDGINRVVLVFGQGFRAEALGTRDDDQRLIVFLVGDREIQFKFGPGFIRRWLSLPDLAVVGKDSSAENELVGDVEYLRRGVRGLTCSGEVDGVFNLLVKILDRLVDVAGLFHRPIIVVKIGRGDLAFNTTRGLVLTTHGLEKNREPDTSRTQCL